MNCGPRCIRYIHRKHGGRLSLARAAKLAHTTSNGSFVSSMIDALVTLGYEARLEQDITWEDLGELVKDNDVIVDWFSELYFVRPTRPDGHYCVVERVEEGAISLYDPEMEMLIRLPRTFFEAHWFDWQVLDGKWIDFCRAAIIAKRQAGGT